MLPNLEDDIRAATWMTQKIRESEIYAQNLYAALCNNEFQKTELWPVLRNERWSCTWRYAGGIIADIRENGDYLDWYCSGMGGMFGSDQDKMNIFVPEGIVTQAVIDDLARLGWHVIDKDAGSV